MASLSIEVHSHCLLQQQKAVLMEAKPALPPSIFYNRWNTFIFIWDTGSYPCSWWSNLATENGSYVRLFQWFRFPSLLQSAPSQGKEGTVLFFFPPPEFQAQLHRLGKPLEYVFISALGSGKTHFLPLVRPLPTSPSYSNYLYPQLRDKKIQHLYRPRGAACCWCDFLPQIISSRHL